VAIPPVSAGPGVATPSTREEALPRPVSIRYLGFRCTGEGREYQLRVDGGAEPRTFVLMIPHAAFAEKLARFQDAPDVCYATLQRVLAADSLLAPGPPLVLTAADLAEYRETRARRSPERKRRRPPSPVQ
jgi:hypothetical protein